MHTFHYAYRGRRVRVIAAHQLQARANALAFLRVPSTRVGELDLINVELDMK